MEYINLHKNHIFGWLMGHGGDDKKIVSPEIKGKCSDNSAEIFSRDLLKGFLGNTSENETLKEEDEEVELNLGLSLGGGFGVEKCPKNLVRSSSVASCLPVLRDDSDTPMLGVAEQGSLARTSSMPGENEDEKRKRKGLQCLISMEGKRKGSDKKMASKGDKEIEVNFVGETNLVAMSKGKGVPGWVSGGMQGFRQVGSQGSSVNSTGGSYSSLMGNLGREKGLPVMKKFDSSVGGTIFEASSKVGGGFDVAMAKGKGIGGGIQGFGEMVSQGSSVESTDGDFLSLMGDLGRKKFDLSVGGTFSEASSNLGVGIDAAMARGKGISGGIQGFGQVVSQGSSVEPTRGSYLSLMGDLEREKHLPEMKKFDSSLGGTIFGASSKVGGGFDVAMARGKGIGGGIQGFGQVVSQGSSVELTGGTYSSLMGDLGRKKFDSSVGGMFSEASSNLGVGFDVAMAKGKGISGGIQGFGQVVSQGSSVESTGGSYSSLMGDLEREKQLPVMKKFDSSVGGTIFEASSKVGGGFDVAMARGKGVSGGIQGFGQVGSQGSSVESTGASSSSLSDMESKALQGSSGELSPASTISLQERTNLHIGSSKAIAKEHPGKATGSEIQGSGKMPADTSRTNRGRDTRTSAVEDMPSVYTRGDGLNSRRVDGILYRYSRGDEVRIMCICHGTFHTPAEFVLHAGGTDTDNPLKHIVINPNSSPLL